MVYLDGEICGNAYRPALFAAALNDLPLALSVRVTVAPGTNAPLGSLIVPRSDVVAIWPKARFTKEKAHRSTNPQSDRFTAVPPKVLHVKTGYEMYGCSLRHMCRLGFQHVTCFAHVHCLQKADRGVESSNLVFLRRLRAAGAAPIGFFYLLEYLSKIQQKIEEPG